MKTFTTFEVAKIADDCEKLKPLVQKNMTTNLVDLILFPELSIVLTKQEGDISYIGSRNKSAKEMFMLQVYTEYGDTYEFGEMVAPPGITVEEAIFSILAIATSDLPDHQQSMLFYDPQPIVRH